jgi:hypothetical protein
MLTPMAAPPLACPVCKAPALGTAIRRIVLGLALVWTGELAAAPAPLPEVGLAFFQSTNVHRFSVEVAPPDLLRLRENPREDVRATVRVGEEVFPDVALHLKGRTGSFRSVDDRPAMTLRFDKFATGRTLQGLTRVHLNNSVEDPSYLHEALGAGLFLDAGVPAARVTHALVKLNDRSLGLYVVKEGFTREFLGRFFRRADGTLYEHVPSATEDDQIRRELGSGPDDRLDLKALAGVLQEPDLKLRWARLQGILDLDRFLSFMALEVMINHRDGYCFAANNYRIYHDPETERLVFLPHGMDQLFGRSDLRLISQMSGPAARSLLEIPEARRLYRARAEVLFTNLFQEEALQARVSQAAARVRPGLEGQMAGEFDAQLALLRQRVANRSAQLAHQLSQPEPTPLRFTNGIVHPVAWREVDVPAGGHLDRLPAPDGRPALHIVAGPATAASWRSRVLLEAGRYRFEGQARTKGVRPLATGRNRGAGLRVSSATLPQPHHLVGDSDWTGFRVEFEVGPTEAEAELICDLRAGGGEAWFDLESLTLLRVP